MKENGSEIDVTNENVREYVDLLIHKRIVGAHISKIKAIRRGFYELWGFMKDQLTLSFSGEELEQLICGTTEIDFTELEKNAVYKVY